VRGLVRTSVRLVVLAARLLAGVQVPGYLTQFEKRVDALAWGDELTIAVTFVRELSLELLAGWFRIGRRRQQELT
jgi:hypothetical protein